MTNKFKYSFDDEPVRKFSYDLTNKKLEISFSGYYDDQDLIDKPCVFIIKNWQESKCKIGDDEKYYSINDQLGVISMILHMQYQNDILTILVNTLDNRYMELSFKKAKLSVEF